MSIVVFSLIFSFNGIAQIDSAASTKKFDTVDISKLPPIKITDSFPPYPPNKKKFWRASGELLLTEFIPWAYNYWVRDADFAHISWESIKHNLQFKNWVWDDNSFNTNQFAHPYHGAMYYSSFRTNGYNFWQSAPAALAGSYLWEVAGETHPPAPNDLINTTLGGIALGEMTYRISNLIVNNKQRGAKRQVNEVLGFLVNPLNGFNRILDGKWGKVMENPADRMPSELSGEIDMGLRRISTKSFDEAVNKGTNQFYAKLRLQYGNHFKDLKKPFDNFSLFIEAGQDDSASINQLKVEGFLTGKLMKDDSSTQHVLALTANYDYFRNSAFFYGAQSVNYNLFSNFRLNKKMRISTEAGIGGILLAAVPDDYLYYGEGRNYDYGMGVSMLGLARLWLNEKFVFIAKYRGGYTATINGNKSTFFLNAVAGEIRYAFIKDVSLGIEGGHYGLKGNYEDYPDVKHKYPYGKISVGYRFGTK